MLKFTVLSENRNNCDFQGESGLSIYIENNNYKFLLDTGYSDLYLENANKLGIDINNIPLVILTHGHSDHTNGVKYLPNRKTIIIHPDGFKIRYSKRKKEYAGFPISEEQTAKLHNLIKTKTPIECLPNIFFLGEIPMNIDFEKGNFSTTLDENLTIIDYIEDDSAIAIKTDLGLVIMTGCGHRGICNTIEYAKAVTGEEKIYAVLGGFHLRDLEQNKVIVDKTIKYFISQNIKKLYLGHCITDDIIDYFEVNLPNIQIERLSTGKHFNI